MNEAAKLMGRKGGLKRAENLTAEQLRSIAMKGVRARRKAASERKRNASAPIDHGDFGFLGRSD